MLPQFDEFHQLDQEHRLLILLLHLMANNPDTNVVHRGGLDGLNFIQHTARDLLADHKIVLDKNILIQALMKFDIACIELNLSSGGSADLLALTIFFLSFRGN